MNCKMCKNKGCVLEGLERELDHKCLCYEGKTNADRIRAMTDEELAHLLHSVEEHLFTGNLWNYEKWTVWLKQEAQCTSE